MKIKALVGQIPGWYRWRVLSDADMPVFCTLGSHGSELPHTLLARPGRLNSRIVFIDGSEKISYTAYAQDLSDDDASLQHLFEPVSVFVALFSMLYRIINVLPIWMSLRWLKVLGVFLGQVFWPPKFIERIKREYFYSFHHHKTQSLEVIQNLISAHWLCEDEDKPLVAEQDPLITIIIPTKDNYSLLKTCIASLLQKTSYNRLEVLIVDNMTTCKDALSYMSFLTEKYSFVKVLHWSQEFNYSAVNNYAAQQAKGDYLLFLNNDTEVVNSNWLEQMLIVAQRSDVGCVGAALFYPNTRVQHVGVALGILGVAGHILRHFPRDHYLTKLMLSRARYVSAVTGACMLIRRRLFEEVRGFDQVSLPIKYSDVDLCLKVHSLGYKNVLTPDAELIHHESVSRLETLSSRTKRSTRKEENVMLRRWWHIINDDPYYDSNFSRIYEDLSLSEKNDIG